MKKLKIGSKGERTRDFFLECAARVIAKEGVERANLVRIAKEAGTVSSHISHYFPRKADLILDVVKYVFAKAFSAVGKSKADHPPEKSLLEAIRENYLYFQKYPHHYSVIVLGYYYARIHKELKLFLGEVYFRNIEGTLTTLRKINESAGLPRSELELTRFAEGFVYELEGGLIYGFFSAHQEPVEQFVNNHLEGLQARIRALFQN